MLFSRKIIVFCSLLIAISCNTNSTDIRPFSKVSITPLFYKKGLSIRALEIIAEDTLALAYNKGFGVLKKVNGRFNTDDLFYGFPSKLNDSLIRDMQFRSVAFAQNKIFALSIGNPAHLIKYEEGDLTPEFEVVYTEENPKVFYDSMAFWDDLDGIAIGDPTEDCLSIIITRDGGETWNKVDCSNIPKAIDGEAAFAASNSNIKVINNKAWVISGGKSSRIYYTEDRGYTWSVYNTPLIQGKPTTGGYALDFYNELNGFIIGGDYTEPNLNRKNKAITTTGGKNWSLVSNGSGVGYKSCVQYVPDTGGHFLVAVGKTGISFSKNSGKDWIDLSSEGFYTIRFLDCNTAYAAGENRVVKLKFE